MIRRLVGSLAATPPSRRRRARVVPAVLACLALASSANAKCHKDCKRLIAATLKACKGACPRKSVGRECQRQCKDFRKASLAACKMATRATPPTCGLSTDTTTTMTSTTTTSTSPIPQELVHRWNWTRVTPLGTFNPATGEPFEPTQSAKLKLKAAGAPLPEKAARDRLDCGTLAGETGGGETGLFSQTAAATAQGQMLTIVSGAGTRQDSNNCNPAQSQTAQLGSVTLTLSWVLTIDPFNQRQALELLAAPFDQTCNPACPDLLLDQIEAAGSVEQLSHV